MLKLFDTFKQGFIILLTSPFWICFFVFKMIYCLILFIYTLICSLILFFQGKPVFFTKEDRAIEKMKENKQKELEEQRQEALRNVEW